MFKTQCLRPVQTVFVTKAMAFPWRCFTEVDHLKVSPCSKITVLRKGLHLYVLELTSTKSPYQDDLGLIQFSLYFCHGICIARILKRGTQFYFRWLEPRTTSLFSFHMAVLWKADFSSKRAGLFLLHFFTPPSRGQYGHLRVAYNNNIYNETKQELIKN